MGTRSDNLATKVEKANSDLLEDVQSLSDERWKAVCADGVWSQGFAGFHAASSIGFVSGMVKGIAEGQPFTPTTMAQIDAGNAQTFAANANCSKHDTVELINNSAPAASQLVRSLSDDQLDRKVTLLEGMPEMSVEQVIEMLLVGHPAGHLASIKNAR